MTDQPAQAAIEIRDLTKVYKGGKRALDGINLTIPRGQIYGLLGPNGAGKSTTINILAGLVNKTSGSASIWGFDIDANPRNAKNSIGIVPQEIVFDPFFTPFETLENQAGYNGVPKDRRRSMELLDEPTAGVDVQLRQQLWAYVKELNAMGVTIVLTTHYLEEAEELCDRIGIINHGRVITDKPTRELIAMAQEKVVQVTVDRDITAPPSDPSFEKVELTDERTLTITYMKNRANAGQVLSAVQAGGLAIVDVVTRDPDLEDVFLNLTAAA